MKKIFIISVILTIFVHATVLAHNWVKIIGDNSNNTMYIDTESAIDLNDLAEFREPHFQAMFKTPEGIGLFNFRQHNGVKYVRSIAVSAEVLNLINLRSTALQANDYYNEMRSLGLKPYLARLAVDRKHDEIRERNEQRLHQGFLHFGLDEDGTINPIGVRLLCKLATENPDAAIRSLRLHALSTSYVAIDELEPLPAAYANLFYNTAFQLMINTKLGRNR